MTPINPDEISSVKSELETASFIPSLFPTFSGSLLTYFQPNTMDYMQQYHKKWARFAVHGSYRVLAFLAITDYTLFTDHCLKMPQDSH